MGALESAYYFAKLLLGNVVLRDMYRIANENKLYSDVHVIAYCYHWTFTDILNLSRPDRKKFVDIIKRQKKAENKKPAKKTPDYAKY